MLYVMIGHSVIQKEYDEGVGTTEVQLLRSFSLSRRGVRRRLNDALHWDVGRHHVDAVLSHDDVHLLLLEAHDRLDRRRVLRVRLDQALVLIRHTDAARLGQGIRKIVKVDRLIMLDRELSNMRHNGG